MYRFLIGAAFVLGACGSAEDDRPQSLEYITQTILAPSCGNAQCHSSFAHVGVPNTSGYAFDTVETSNSSIVCGGLVVPGDTDSFLLVVLTRPGGDMAARMPYDSPLPNPDIALIRSWIESGAAGLKDGVPCE